MKINIITTAESLEQAKALLENGADTIYIGDEDFSLRVPTPLKRQEMSEIVKLTHSLGKTVTVAVNALMHVDKMAIIKEYLDFLQELKVDQITVGDTGVIYVLQRDKYQLPYIYDASTLVASSRQVNFWAKQGAVGAVLARELPKAELEEMAKNLEIPAEILIYGATVIHHSKRPLLQNYFNFSKIEGEGKTREDNHFISEPLKDETHYSIFEDNQGTHVFANDDLNMMTELSDLAKMGYYQWKLDGIFTRGDKFVEILKVYDKARQLIENEKMTEEKALELEEEIKKLHPEERTLSHGFYDINPNDIR
ncbi:MAG: peptidase U32 family protein [Lactovum sp.]